jgi:FkbM family methyltransferase
MKLAGTDRQKNLRVQTKAGIFHLPNLLDMISIDLYMNGYYEKGLVDHLISNVPPNGVFLDVGANIGSISIPLAKARPDVRIISVEASPWIFDILAKNVSANGCTNITPLNFAVFNESGKSLPMYAPKDLFGKGSLKSVYTSDGEMVQTITIDDIRTTSEIGCINYIKVDVEGFEAAVFNGMSEVAKNDKPRIIFEFSEWAELAAGFQACEAQSIILSKGYRLQEMDSNFKPVGQPVSTTFRVKGTNLFAS